MLISLLFTVLIIGLLIWLVQMLPIPEPMRTIAIVIVVIIAILYLLEGIGGVGLGYHRALL